MIIVTYQPICIQDILLKIQNSSFKHKREN